MDEHMIILEQQEEIQALRNENTKLRNLMKRAEPIVNAAENLVKMKGRYHTEQAYVMLVDAMDAALKES